MKKLMNKLNNALMQAKNKAAEFVSNERGDTNFISIAIILIVIIGVAIVFIGFRDSILAAFTEATQDLLDALGA